MTAGRVRSSLDVVTNVAFTLAALAIVWRVGFAPTPAAAPSGRTSPPRIEDLSTKNLSLAINRSAQKGNEKSDIVLIEFSDYQCPFCGHFARDTFKQLDEKFVASERVQYVFKNLPLEIHKEAMGSAQAAECAGRQGKYWEMHSALFSKQEELPTQVWMNEAREMGLDMVGFESCVNGAKAINIVGDIAEAKRLGVTGTPTFFVGRRSQDGSVKLMTRISGAQPISVFESVLSEALE